MLGMRGRRGASLKPNDTQRMHVLPPRRVPAGTVKATAQESEEDGTPPAHPGMPGTEKHALLLCWTLFEVCSGACHSENGG